MKAETGPPAFRLHLAQARHPANIPRGASPCQGRPTRIAFGAEIMRNLLRRYTPEQLYLVVSDYLILVGTFAVTLRLRFMPEIDIIDIRRMEMIPQMLFMFPYAAALLCLFQYDDLYKRKLWLSPFWHMIELFRVTYLAVVIYIFLHFATKAQVFLPNRSVVLGWGVFASVVLVLHRVVLFGPLLRVLVSRARWRRRVIVIGTGKTAKEFARACAAGGPYHTLEVVGFLDDAHSANTDVLPGLPCLGKTGDLRRITGERRIEGAVITLSDVSYDRLMELIEEAASLFGWVDVHSDKAACLQRNLNVDTYFETPFVRMGRIAGSPLIAFYKRLTDLLGSALGIFVLSPVYILIALAVKLTSRGPIFYVTNRVGYKGQHFKFYKFRSMRVGADADAARQAEVNEYITNPEKTSAKIVNPALLTPIGGFLRKWALDELPQLFNVLRGHMSLIGPRPSPIREYDVNDEWHKRRFDIKPGCTGLWKLHAGQENRFADTVLYDIYYARNMGPLLDFYILLGTLRIIFSGNADE